MLKRLAQLNICCFRIEICGTEKEAVILFTLEGGMIKNHHLHHHQIHHFYH